MKLGTLAIRGVVGPLFFGHGTQKLFGWFGGHGIEGTAGFFEQGLGLRPGRRHATAAGIAEALGGALLTIGALTPVAASMVSGSMITAIRKAHASKGPWVTEGGYEYNAVLLAAMIAITEAGPGKPSVDAALFPRMKGTGWAILQLAAAAAGSWLATDKLTEAVPEQAQEQAEAPQETVTEDEPRVARDEVPAESQQASPSSSPAA